jgi:hypothetical protein
MPNPVTKRAAVLLIETDSILVIGPSFQTLGGAKLERD